MTENQNRSEAANQIRNQTGPQSQFSRCSADIAIYGGSAGGGKTFALLLEALRHTNRPGYGAVIFRKTNPEIKGIGGLWSESLKIYPYAAGVGRYSNLRWRFPSGAEICFSHMEHDDHRFAFMGQQIAWIGFDELTHFSYAVFSYMLSRNRSTCGVRPRIRATCNPDADSWVAEFISWWIDPETGYAIPERSGVIRWFAQIGDQRHTAGTRAELLAIDPNCAPLSYTFIRSSLDDNKKLLEADPHYITKLKNLSRVDRERLLHGNWKIKPAAGMYFQGNWFETVDAAPMDIVARCRFWDRAGTKKEKDNKPDWTVGLLMSKDRRGIYYVEDVRRFQESPHNVDQAMGNTATQDPPDTIIAYMQDPGSAGKNEAEATARLLAGFTVKFETSTGSKETRAKPASSQAEANNIKIVRAPWNSAFLRELENFPEGANDDQVDAFSGAFNELCLHGGSGDFSRVMKQDHRERPQRGQGIWM